MANKIKLVNVSDETTTYEDVVDTLREQQDVQEELKIIETPVVIEKPKRIRTKKPVEVIPPALENTPTETEAEPPEETPQEKPKPKRKAKVVISNPEPIEVIQPEIISTNSEISTVATGDGSVESLESPVKAKPKRKAKPKEPEVESDEPSKESVVTVTKPKAKARTKKEPTPEAPQPEIIKKPRAKRAPKLIIEPPKERMSRLAQRVELYEKLASQALG